MREVIHVRNPHARAHARAWGYDFQGQLGNGIDDPDNSPSPAAVAGPGGTGQLTAVTALGGGELHIRSLRLRRGPRLVGLVALGLLIAPLSGCGGDRSPRWPTAWPRPFDRRRHRPRQLLRRKQAVATFIHARKVVVTPSATSADLFCAFRTSKAQYLWRPLESEIAQVRVRAWALLVAASQGWENAEILLGGFVSGP